MDISQALRAPGEQIPFLHRDKISPQEIFRETVTFDDVLLQGTYAMFDTSLHLKGKLTTTAHALCAACLKEVDHPVQVDFDEVFTRTEDHPRYPAQEEQNDDDEELTFAGSKVDLGHLVLTLVLLELPVRFLCSEECSARPQENDETDACQKDSDQNPFSALQELLEKEQEE